MQHGSRWGAVAVAAALVVGACSGSVTSTQAPTVPASAAPSAAASAAPPAAASAAAPAASSAAASYVPSTTVPSGVVPALQALVPASAKSSGELTVGSGLNFPPYTFKNAAGTATGIEPDLVNMIGQMLGLKVVYSQLQFPALLPSLQNGRNEIGLDQLADTPAREQAVNFVDYLKGADSLLVKPGNPTHISVNDLCGHTLAVVTGTVEVTLMQSDTKACTAAGKPAIKLLVLGDSSTQFLAVQNGRADAAPVEVAVAAYLAQHSNGQTATLNAVLPGLGYTVGIAVSKSSGLTNAIEASVQQIMADGQYQKLLATWHDTLDAVNHVAVNDPNLWNGQ